MKKSDVSYIYMSTHTATPPPVEEKKIYGVVILKHLFMAIQDNMMKHPLDHS